MNRSGIIKIPVEEVTEFSNTEKSVSENSFPSDMSTSETISSFSDSRFSLTPIQTEFPSNLSLDASQKLPIYFERKRVIGAVACNFM
jgi:hypothetical protein